MPSNILGYCHLALESGGDLVTASASRIEAQWNTGVALWDDGVNKYAIWGDTEGVLNIFDLETEYSGASPLPYWNVINNYEDDLSISITTARLQGGSAVVSTRSTIVSFNNNCYRTGAENKRLRPLGDRYVIEGATDFKIFQTNGS